MALRPHDLMLPTREGLYCPLGDFHIDPIKPVERALITHGHADHARPGHAHVLATAETLAIMRLRMGERFAGSAQAIGFGERLTINGVSVSYHPAGHILGAAQIALAAGGLTVVFSGDYKREADATANRFEPVQCQVFITEATFGLPVFRHPPAQDEAGKLLASMARYPERTHMIGAYALGKAQRLIALVRAGGYDGPIHLHGAVDKVTRGYTDFGFDFGDIRTVPPKKEAGGEPIRLVICPPSALADRWAQRFGDAVHAVASGWMRVKARARQKGVELPLVISDHADWPDLQRTIVETRCEELWVTHGQEDALVHWATGQGLAAKPLYLVGFGEDDEEPGSGAP